MSHVSFKTSHLGPSGVILSTSSSFPTSNDLISIVLPPSILIIPLPPLGSTIVPAVGTAVIELPGGEAGLAVLETDLLINTQHDHAHADMLYSRLVPTSFDQYSTLFTTAVLDDFRLSNLECKTSAYQYFQKLRRETAPVSPAEVVNRSVTNTRCRGQLLHPLASYTELRRLSRQWRWLKQLKWAGYSHSGGHVREPQPGQLTLFCPACPQPGRNLPDSWKGDPNKSVPWHHVFIFFADMFFRKVFYRSFVADGNFKADHVRQKRSAGDVWLSEGGGMMPLREHYNEFLQTAAERPTVSCWFCQHQLN